MRWTNSPRAPEDARSVSLIVGKFLVPLDGVDLNTLFDELAAIEDQLKPLKHELEELGL